MNTCDRVWHGQILEYYIAIAPSMFTFFLFFILFYFAFGGPNDDLTYTQWWEGAPTPQWWNNPREGQEGETGPAIFLLVPVFTSNYWVENENESTIRIIIMEIWLIKGTEQLRIYGVKVREQQGAKAAQYASVWPNIVLISDSRWFMRSGSALLRCKL